MATEPPFKFWSFFFSLRGRVSRRAFALFEIPVALALWVLSFAVGWMFRNLSGIAITDISMMTMMTGLLSFALLWPRFAVLVKRLHDAGWPWLSGMIILLPIPLAAARGLTGFLDAQSGFQTNNLASPVFLWLNWAVTLANYGLILVMCVLPARHANNRYGPDPRRSETATDAF